MRNYFNNSIGIVRRLSRRDCTFIVNSTHVGIMLMHRAARGRSAFPTNWKQMTRLAARRKNVETSSISQIFPFEQRNRFRFSPKENGRTYIIAGGGGDLFVRIKNLYSKQRHKFQYRRRVRAGVSHHESPSAIEVIWRNLR